MRISLTHVLAFVMLCGPAGRYLQAAEPQPVDVFVGGAEGYHTYRIPSLICTPKGVLLAFCEGRKFSSLDETPTDVVLKRSLDGGKTWNAMQVLVPAVPEAAMNPCAVFDRVTGAVLLVYDLWPEFVQEKWSEGPARYKRQPGLGRDSVTAWIMASPDDGATWSAPVDITAMVKKPEWTMIAHGPGVGIQTRSGRLAISGCRGSWMPEVWWDYVIYSDDHGKTWRLSDNEVGPGVDESQLVELADGTLLLNMRSQRNKGCRASATSTDGSKTWSNLFDVPALPERPCQASILRYSWADQSGNESLILFSNPASLKDRLGGTVRISYDEGTTWPVAKMIRKDYFGYSCLAALPSGEIGCLFESEVSKTIAMTSFPLKWLTQ